MPNASTGDRRDDPANERGAQQLRGELAAQKDHNARLIATLRDAREQIVTLKADDQRIVIYAKRDIEPGEELTYDYSFSAEDHPVPCKCGAPMCRAFINKVA